MKWKQTADAHLLRQKVNQRWHTIGGWFTLELIVSDKKKGKLDLDNRVKGVLDWAQQAGVVENDKYLDRLVCTWGDAPLGIRAIFRSNADPAG